MKCVLALVGLLSLSLAQVAEAQVPLTPAAADPDAKIVEELVVTARYPGPVFWKVSDGDSTVYVLGVPSLAPRRQVWDQARFAHYLAGANEVILPFNSISVSLLGAPGAALGYLRLRSSRPFEAGLDPATQARFVAARQAVGQPAGHYKVSHPLAAGLMLINDFREYRQLTANDPAKLIGLLARRDGVKVVQKSYEVGPLLGAIVKTSPGAGRTCLDVAIEEATSGPESILAASRAWAEGDVASALAAERTYEKCLAVTPGAAAFFERVKRDEIAQISTALKSPGHAIALVPLRTLLAEDGVLERLKAAGYAIE